MDSDKPRRTLDQLPGPAGLPLLGNVHQMDFARLHLKLEEWAQVHGGMYAIGIGTRRTVVVSDPELIRFMLRERPEQFRRFRAVARVIDELGLTSLFSSEGDSWQRQRRIYMRALNIHQTRPFFARLTAITRRLLARWQRRAAGGEPFDVLPDLMKYTLDVTTLFAFGYDANTLEDARDEIQQRLSRLLPMVARRSAAPFPWWHYVRLPADRRLERDLAALRAYVEPLVEAARRRLQADPLLRANPTNLLEALIAARDADGSPFTDQDVYANALGTLVAGEDTTATTLAWMLHFLAGHPDVQQRLHAESAGVLGADPVWERYEDGERLHYADAVMSETFRFKPIAPAFFLCTNESVDLGGYRLPAGTDVLAIVRTASMSDAEFPDASSFSPGRWLAPEQAGFATRPPLPFGSGPRMCPGRNLAQLEIKSVASMVARNFEVVRAPGAGPVTERFSFTLMPENLSLVLRPRTTL